MPSNYSHLPSMSAWSRRTGPELKPKPHTLGKPRPSGRGEGEERRKKRRRKSGGSRRRRLNWASAGRNSKCTFTGTKKFFLPITCLSTLIRIYREPITTTSSTFHCFYRRNGDAYTGKCFEISWAIMLSERSCYYVRISFPWSLRQSRENHECWEPVRMMWGQGKRQLNVGKDIFKQHPCHLFKNTFHSTAAQELLMSLERGQYATVWRKAEPPSLPSAGIY